MGGSWQSVNSAMQIWRTLTHGSLQPEGVCVVCGVFLKRADRQHCGQETLLIRFTFGTGPHPFCPSLMCVCVVFVSWDVILQCHCRLQQAVCHRYFRITFPPAGGLSGCACSCSRWLGESRGVSGGTELKSSLSWNLFRGGSEMNPGCSGMWGLDRPRVKSLLSGNSQGMGSASPQEPEKDMEGYYNLLQAGSELENTLQREYMLIYVFKTTIFVHKDISFSGCSLAFYVVLQGLCLLFIT